MSVRALVVEDEPLARSGIVRLVRSTPGFEVTGEASDGPHAVAAVRSLHPDLVLLDVHIPGFDGFDVIRKVGPERMPLVVFITAHDDYAVRAFETQALDYVLKPFEDSRLRAALLRAGRLVSAPDLARRLRALIADDSTPAPLGGLARQMLLRLEPQQPRRVQPRWLQRALETLEVRFAEPLGLRELAQTVGVHPVYLARAFRAHLGMTPGGYLRKVRVDCAAQRLTESDESIAEIAVEAGFSDQSHLTRVFRRALGTTPAQYRRRFPRR